MSESAEPRLWGKSWGDGLTVSWEPQLGAEPSRGRSAGAGGRLSVRLLQGSLWAETGGSRPSPRSRRRRRLLYVLSRPLGGTRYTLACISQGRAVAEGSRSE